MITLDPERDTPERLREYVANFHPRFRTGFGDRDTIDRLAAQMQVRYKVAPHEPGDAYYTVAHTSIFGIVDPAGRLVAILDDTEKATELADELEALRESTREPTG